MAETVGATGGEPPQPNHSAAVPGHPGVAVTPHAGMPCLPGLATIGQLSGGEFGPVRLPQRHDDASISARTGGHDKEDSELRKYKHRPLVSPPDASQLRWLNECIGGPSGSSTKVLHTLQTRRTEGLHA